MPNNNPEGHNQYTKNRNRSDQDRQKSSSREPAVHTKRDSGTTGGGAAHHGGPAGERDSAHDRDTARDDEHPRDDMNSTSGRTAR